MVLYHCNVCKGDFEVRGNAPPRGCKLCGSWRWNIAPEGQQKAIETETKGIHPDILKGIVKEVINEYKAELKGEVKPESTIDKVERWMPLISQFLSGILSGVQARQEMKKADEDEVVTPPPDYGTLKQLEHRFWNPNTMQMEYYPEYQLHMDKYEAYLRKHKVIPTTQAPAGFQQQIMYPPYIEKKISEREQLKQIPKELLKQQQTQEQQKQQIDPQQLEEELKLANIQMNIKKGIDYLDKIPLEKFKDWIDNLDANKEYLKTLISPITKILIFSIIPKSIIEQTTFMELLNLMKEQLPDKYEIAKSKKLELENAFNELKDLLLGIKENKEEVIESADNNSGNDERTKEDDGKGTAVNSDEGKQNISDDVDESKE